MVAIDELARRFRAQSDAQTTRSPFSARLCAAIADDPAAIEILQAAPEQQQIPVLLLAALHDDVLARPDCELAGWYPTVTSTPRADDVAGALRRHLERRGSELRTTVATRVTQTNEVGRCGLFLPPLGLLAGEVGPLALVDVGTSAGLNLHLDRYEYRYEPGGAVGGPSPVRIETGTRGPVPVPAAVPEVATRIGIDRHPVDVTDAAATRWLRACVWPDQPDRFRRLEAALEIARHVPPDVRAVDAVAGLAPAVADAAGHPVVLNSWVLNYLPAAHRSRYVDELDRIGRDRDLSWVFAESPVLTQGLPYPEHLAGVERTALMLVRWRAGHRSADHLGVAHPHGYWLHWRRDPTPDRRRGWRRRAGSGSVEP